MEITGFGPNMRDIDGTFIGNIVETEFFRRFFTFYETPWYNLFTVFFGGVTVIHMTIGIIKTFVTDNR